MPDVPPPLTVTVTADKPGRVVAVDSETTEDGQALLTLRLNAQGGLGQEDSWTWLTSDEARKIAAALVRAADQLDAARGG